VPEEWGVQVDAGLESGGLLRGLTSLVYPEVAAGVTTFGAGVWIGGQIRKIWGSL
jgi:hypothetical protein